MFRVIVTICLEVFAGFSIFVAIGISGVGLLFPGCWMVLCAAATRLAYEDTHKDTKEFQWHPLCLDAICLLVGLSLAAIKLGSTELGMVTASVVGFAGLISVWMHAPMPQNEVLAATHRDN